MSAQNRAALAELQLDAKGNPRIPGSGADDVETEATSSSQQSFSEVTVPIASLPKPKLPTPSSMLPQSLDRLKVQNASPFYRSPGAFLDFKRMRPGCRTSSPMDTFIKYGMTDDAISCIFSWLNKVSLLRCARTCQRFYRLSMNAQLWQRIDCGQRKIPESAIHNLLTRGAQMIRLAKAEIPLDMEPRRDSVMLYPHLDTCRLTHVDMSMAVYDSVDLIAGLLQRCVKLQALSLELGMVDERVCVAIGRNPELRMLHLGMCSGLDVEGLQAIVCGCRVLEEVNLAWTGLRAAECQMLVSLLPHTVRRLNISGVRERDQLRNEDIATLIKTCSNLIELDISDSPTVTSTALDALIVKLPTLRTLCVSRCYGIEPVSYTTCGRLAVLNIFGCVTEEGYDLLRGRLPNTKINADLFSTIARPTVGVRRTSIWDQRVRDE
uniref:F-box domain-containing protein n=1 Tax=Plectus sambesii TaxID=2011161 RepID=A0A914UHK4_9BILA